MKKLLALLTIVGLGLVSEMNAGRKYAVDLGDCPMPCCEKQELVTIRKPAEIVCGYVCPNGTVENENGK